jgi:GNAT superfamily N-acetyltransferase
MTAGTGRYIVTSRKSEHIKAEFALTVTDQYQGLGIGTMLMKHLIAIAQDNGVTEFTALVLNQNKRILDLVEHLSLPIAEKRDESGAVEVSIDLRKQAEPYDNIEPKRGFGLDNQFAVGHN